MSEINNNYLEGHYSTETKVKRPKIVAAEAPAILPKQTLFSNKDAGASAATSFGRLTFVSVE